MYNLFSYLEMQNIRFMTKNSKDKKGLRFNKTGIKKAVLSVYYDNVNKAFNYKQLASLIEANDESSRKLLNKVLMELRDAETLDEVERGKFRLKYQGGFVTGIIDTNPKGYGELVCEELPEPVFISEANMGHALDGDKVRVRLYARRKRSTPEGEVIEVLERAKTTFVGTVEISQFTAFLIPSRKAPFDLYIPKEKLNGAVNGQKAIARILDWPEHAHNPFAEIIEVLGDSGTTDTEMHAILDELGLPHKYPENGDRAANKIRMEI